MSANDLQLAIHAAATPHDGVGTVSVKLTVVALVKGLRNLSSIIELEGDTLDPSS